MKKNDRYACIGLVSLLGLGLTGLSYVRLRAATRQPQFTDKLIAQAGQEDSIGNRKEALALTNQAADILQKHIGDADARERLAGCTLDLCEFGDRKRAADVFRLLNNYPGPKEKVLVTFYEGFMHNERAFRTAPLPTPAMIAFRKDLIAHGGHPL